MDSNESKTIASLLRAKQLIVSISKARSRQLNRQYLRRIDIALSRDLPTTTMRQPGKI
jgi:hypothetical protein